MSDWNNFKMPPNNSGDILKLEDGKPVKVRVIGEPYVYQSDYKGKPSTRFALAIWNQGTKAAQIMMLPKTPFGQIMDLATNEDWGDPEMYDITVKRTGTGKETEYSVQPSPNKKELSQENKDLVSAIDLKVVLERLPSVQFAIPLSEVDDDYYTKSKEATSSTEPQQTQDVVVEVGDDPINLDDIPF